MIIKRITHSRAMIYSLILSLLFLTVPELLSGNPRLAAEEEKPVIRVKGEVKTVSAALQQRFQQLLAEGKRLYRDEMDYNGAIQILNQALNLAVSKEQKTEVYFYLSLALYATLEERGDAEFNEVVKSLVRVDYYYKLDESICPSGYLELFREIKKNFGVLKIRSKPAGADVYLNDSRTAEGKTPLTIVAPAGTIKIQLKKGNKEIEDQLFVLAGQETLSREYELKGKSSMIYIIGGLAVAGGLSAALLLGGGGGNGGGGEVTPSTGSIQVNSIPTGAAVWLDGNNLGQETDCTLTDISPGSHTVQLIRDDYEDYVETVTVTAGQTTTINANLTLHTITIVSPDSQTKWNKGEQVEITWDVSGSSISQNSLQSNFINSLRSENLHSLSLIRRNAIRLKIGARNFSAPGGSNQRIDMKSRGRGISFESHTSMGGGENNWRSSSNTIGSGLLKSPVGTSNNGLILPFRPTHQQKDAGILVVTKVRIELLDGDDLVDVIIQETDNLGQYTWTVDPWLSDGTEYRIIVLSVTDSNVYAVSDYFEIRAGGFEEGFDTDDRVDEFFEETHPNLWEVQDGAYEVTGNVSLNERSTSHYTMGNYTDFTYEVDCGNEDRTAVWYGIAFRGNKNFSSYYFFYVTPEGRYQIRANKKGTEREIVGETAHTAINTGAHQWNKLRVEAVGQNFNFYINGQLVASRTIEGAPEEGRIGLVTRTNYLNVKFDDMVVGILE